MHTSFRSRSLNPHLQGERGNRTQSHRQTQAESLFKPDWGFSLPPEFQAQPWQGKPKSTIHHAYGFSQDVPQGKPGPVPLGICFLSCHGSPSCDTGCVVVSGRKSKDKMHLQGMPRPAPEVTGGLLSKLVIWGSRDLRLPHLLLGAAAA